MLIGIKDGKYAGYSNPDTQAAVMQERVRSGKIDYFVKMDAVPDLGEIIHTEGGRGYRFDPGSAETKPPKRRRKAVVGKK